MTGTRWPEPRPTLPGRVGQCQGHLSFPDPARGWEPGPDRLQSGAQTDRSSCPRALTAARRKGTPRTHVGASRVTGEGTPQSSTNAGRGRTLPHPARGGRGDSPPHPDCPTALRGGGVSPPPHPGGSAAGGEANPGRHRGGGGTAPYPSPQPSPQRLLPASVTGAAPAVPPPNRKPAHARLAASRPHPAPARGHLACWQVKPAPLPAAISCEVTSPASG